MKFNPFRPDVPVEALYTTPPIDTFLRRAELGITDGGFARVTGDPGTGKTIVLRLLTERLRLLPNVIVGTLDPRQQGSRFKATALCRLRGGRQASRAPPDRRALPLGSRIRRRLPLEYASRDELCACLEHLLHTADNPSLVTPELKAMLAQHAAGNYRVLMNLADELLMIALDRELPRLDEKLFFDVFTQTPKSKSTARRR